MMGGQASGGAPAASGGAGGFTGTGELYRAAQAGRAQIAGAPPGPQLAPSQPPPPQPQQRERPSYAAPLRRHTNSQSGPRALDFGTGSDGVPSPARLAQNRTRDM